MKLPAAAIKKIGVFRALQLGDLLCSVPAIKSLRYAYPNAEITLLSLPWAESLIKRFPKYFDRFIHFPGYPGLPEQLYDEVAFKKFTGIIQSENFDLLLQMQGNGTIVNKMLEPMNAKHLAGFCFDDCNDDALFLKYPSTPHEIIRHIMLMDFLGIPSQGTQLEFPLYKKDYDDFKALDLSLLSNRYVCIHPGSRGNWRQWPPEYFAQLGDYFARQNLAIVITGTQEEQHIINRVKSCMQCDAIDLCGRTNLGAISVLLKNAFMLISNCTGVSHIASALKVPGIIISMDGEPTRWAPLDTLLHKTIDWTKYKDFNVTFEAAKNLHRQLAVVKKTVHSV